MIAERPMAPLPAEPAHAARADAGDQHAVADLHHLHARTDCVHRADRLVTEDASWRDGRHVTFEDVQVGAADRGGVDAHDGVSVVRDRGIGYLLPRLLARAVVDERLHGQLRCSIDVTARLPTGPQIQTASCD